MAPWMWVAILSFVIVIAYACTQERSQDPYGLGFLFNVAGIVIMTLLGIIAVLVTVLIT